MLEERAFWLAWSQIKGLGPVLLKRLHSQFGSLAAAWEADAPKLQTVEGIGPQLSETILRERDPIDPDLLLHQHEQDNPCFWTPADPDYPRLLLEIPDPPPVLYYQGQIQGAENQGNRPMIGVVGTRDPSDYGRRWTRRLSAALSQNGFTIISGLAEGIDAEAHRSCLTAEGRTIAVLGSGLDVIYPWSNRHLYDQILEQGLILSEYPARTQPDRSNFPRRNRIVAGLSRAILVMEAPRKSGALITARLANDYGRDVYVLPGSLDNPKALGCLNLLQRGAQIILGESQLLEALGTMPQLSLLDLLEPAALDETEPLEPLLAQVLTTLTKPIPSGNDAVSFDWIVQQSGLAAGVVSAALLQLELMGLVAQLPGMRYQAR